MEWLRMLYPIKEKTMNPLKAMVAIILCIGSLHAQETETKDTLSVDTKYLDEGCARQSTPLKAFPVRKNHCKY